MIVKIEKVRLFQDESTQWIAQVDCTKLPVTDNSSVTYILTLDHTLWLSTINLASKIANHIAVKEGAEGEIKVVESSWSSL